MPSPASLLRLPSKLRRRARRSRLATLISLVAIFGLLVSPLYIVYKPPALLIRYFQYRWQDVLWQVPSATKIVALTIDDAPSEYTDALAQELAANDAHATFFVIGGQVVGREENLRDLVRGGHELGNHAMQDEPSRSLSDATLVEQIEAVQAQLHAAYAAVGAEPPPKYFRPGSGFFSDRMRRVVAKLGYRLVLGGIYPHDPQIPFSRLNASHILSMLRPGAIIICHDRRGWTVPMLRTVLPEIRHKGYRIVTVTKLLKEGS